MCALYQTTIGKDKGRNDRSRPALFTPHPSHDRGPLETEDFREVLEHLVERRLGIDSDVAGAELLPHHFDGRDGFLPVLGETFFKRFATIVRTAVATATARPRNINREVEVHDDDLGQQLELLRQDIDHVSSLSRTTNAAVDHEVDTDIEFAQVGLDPAMGMSHHDVIADELTCRHLLRAEILETVTGHEDLAGIARLVRESDVVTFAGTGGADNEHDSSLFQGILLNWMGC